MPRGVVSAARRQAAKKHADRPFTCSCGRVVWGNGGESSHKRACRTYQANRLQALRETIARDELSPPRYERLTAQFKRDAEKLEALLARWPEGQRRPKDEARVD